MIASDILKNIEIPRTKARVQILQALMDAHKPLSILELKGLLPHFNESSLYRNLEKFRQLKIVKKLNIDSDFSHFEFQPLISGQEVSNPKHHSHHHHIVCIKCKTIECLDICGVENLILPKIKKTGFTQINHVLEFSGICKRCSE